MPDFAERIKKNFDIVADRLFELLSADEEANLNLHAESSLFLRFNNNKIRQNTSVEQLSLELILQSQQRSAQVGFSITGHPNEDLQRLERSLHLARQECLQLPADPYQVPLQNNGESDVSFQGHLLSAEDLIPAITTPAQGSDLAGLYCGGPLIAANRNSKGQRHWFATENFFMDYSLYDGEKAVKGSYAGSQWDSSAFDRHLSESRQQLKLMRREKKNLPPGAYRVYLAPAAVAEISTMFYWGALSFSGFKQGQSAFQKLALKEESLSPLFSMRENYSLGLATPFNSLGELAPEKMDLIAEGQLKNFMISTRSAKEYQVTGNAAGPAEAPRSLEILPGTLKQADILQELDTGIYISNLHYINWSDRLTARITGMTRYACFWVDKGEIISPIADLRFDESLYDCLGKNLLAVTDFQHIDPEISTYDNRILGGKKVPGLLIRDFKFTL